MRLQKLQNTLEVIIALEYQVSFGEGTRSVLQSTERDSDLICRMHSDMEKDGLRREHWRKSGQWIALIREHAEAVVNDTIVSKLFKECVPLV